VCKTMGRNCPIDDFDTWHDTPVPSLELTASMEAAGNEIRLARMRYNSAYSAGCPCCPE
jgi:hypothetical protein